LEPYILKKLIDGVVIIVPKKQFSDDEFSDNEMKLLDEIVNRFQYCTAKELVNFTHKKNSPWYNTAIKNGILELLENGKITTTNIEIDMAETIKDDVEKISIYNGYREFLIQSKSLKA
jgi:uncharacterized phage-associated protein